MSLHPSSLQKHSALWGQGLQLVNLCTILRFAYIMDYVIDTAVCPLAYYLNPSDTTVAVGHSCWCPNHVSLGLGIVRFLGLLAAMANISLPRAYSGVHSAQGHHGRKCWRIMVYFQHPLPDSPPSWLRVLVYQWPSCLPPAMESLWAKCFARAL